MALGQWLCPNVELSTLSCPLRSDVTASKVTDNLELLRQGWLEAASTMAPGVPALSDLLVQRLNGAQQEDRLDEPTLLGAVDDATRIASEALAPDAASALARRLQRSVYEYLLSLDALRTEEATVWPSRTLASTGEGAVLIGAEEVAALHGDQVEAPAAPEPPEETVVDAEGDESGDTEPVKAERGKGKRRFRLFRRGGSADQGDAAAPEAVTETEAPVPNPEAFPPLVHQRDPADGPHVVPRDGFHIRERQETMVISAPTDLGGQPPRPQDEPAPEMSALVQLAMSQVEPLPEEKKRWQVREQRPDGKRRKRGSEDKSSSPAQDDESPFDTDAAVIDARRQIDDRLKRRRCDEAAGLIQRMARDLGGHAVAELALDAGDRCRALGKSNAALSCYLAATRADPVYDAPLLRLVDVCLDDHDIDLAVSYLERIARLHRLRGDQRGALRIYRKIATVAPNRDDILNVLIRAQATGRFDD